MVINSKNFNIDSSAILCFYIFSFFVEAKKYVLQLLLTISTSEHSLLAFLPANNLDKIGEEVNKIF